MKSCFNFHVLISEISGIVKINVLKSNVAQFPFRFLQFFYFSPWSLVHSSFTAFHHHLKRAVAHEKYRNRTTHSSSLQYSTSQSPFVWLFSSFSRDHASNTETASPILRPALVQDHFQ